MLNDRMDNGGTLFDHETAFEYKMASVATWPFVRIVVHSVRAKDADGTGDHGGNVCPVSRPGMMRGNQEQCSV